MPDFDFSTRYARKSDSDFVLAAGRAFYVDYWAMIGQDENGNGGNGDKVPGGCDLLDYAPQTQRWALALARSFVADLERKFARPIAGLIEEWRTTAEGARYCDRDPTDINLGFYAAMEAMGHGVGLGDMGIDVDLPYIEAYPRS